MATLKKIIYVLTILFLSLHVAEGAETQNVQLYHLEMVTREGQQLQIPCNFNIEDHDNDHKIELEWSVKPTGSDSFTPIMKLDDTRLLPVNNPNKRASIDLMGVRKGHCNLVIDPVKPTDSGTYQVRIGINSQDNAQTTNLRVLKRRRRSLNSMDTTTSHPTNDVEDQSDSQDTESDTMRAQNIIKNLKSKGTLLYFAIVGGELITLLVLGSIAAIIAALWYFKLRRKMTEEGSLPVKLSVKPEVSISMDMIEKEKPKHKGKEKPKHKGKEKHKHKEKEKPKHKENEKPKHKENEKPKHKENEKPTQPDVKIRIEDPTSGQSLTTTGQSSEEKIQSLTTTGQSSEEKIQSPKTKYQFPKAEIQPTIGKMTKEIPKEPAKNMDVIINIEDPEAGKQPETADPSSPAGPSSVTPEKSTTPEETEEDNLYQYEFLGIRWGFNWGKYWIIYPTFWK